MKNVKDVEEHLFVASWRIARERIRQQAPTIRTMFESAAAARADQPIFPTYLRLDKMTDNDDAALRDFFEKNGSATGARDAYASGIIFFLDDVFRETECYLKHLRTVPKEIGPLINGIPVPKAIRAGRNSASHYLDWRGNVANISQPKRAYETICTIAQILGEPIPNYETFPSKANNRAWAVLNAIGAGTADGLISKVREHLDEFIRSVGLENEPLILADIARERLE